LRRRANADRSRTVGLPESHPGRQPPLVTGPARNAKLRAPEVVPGCEPAHSNLELGDGQALRSDSVRSPGGGEHDCGPPDQRVSRA
jgi:hypothetical protein